MKPNESRNIFTLVTETSIRYLQDGIVPWKLGWGAAGPPRDFYTGEPYRGINVWLLNALRYELNLFLGYDQVRTIGGQVRNGEKAHHVICWEWADEIATNPIITGQKTTKVLTCSIYPVFNVAQCYLPEYFFPLIEPQLKRSPLRICEEIIELMPNVPEIRHLGDKPYYHPFFDFINMPAKERYMKDETYYTNLFHQIIHATGHEKRLNRKEMNGVVATPVDMFSLEELTADMGGNYLVATAGIYGWDTVDHRTYVTGWLERLQHDDKCLVYAAIQMQHAIDYILNPRASATEIAHTEHAFLKSVAV